MVATDTLVGVAGAVLLAAVMIGVFVYEYNNAPSTTDMGHGKGPLRTPADFAKAYPLLGANDDLDGDHVANYNDTDMDGNGMADANQTGDLVVRGHDSGSTPAPPATMTKPIAIVVGKGDQPFHAEIN